MNVVKKQQRKIPLKKFSGRRVIEVLVYNLIVTAVIYLFFGWFLNNTREFFISKASWGFTFYEALLCLVLATLVNGMIDYQLLIKSVWEMESAVLRYQDAVREEEAVSIYEHPEDASVETTLYYLLKQQEVSYEKHKKAEKQRKNVELYALQSQIDPHFLYNALDSIRGYALLNDMEEISEITEALSRVFRNMISDRQEQIPLRQEMDNINSYMRIQKFRFNDKFKYYFDVEEEMLDKYMVPRMVLQPLIENAIMHGLEMKVEGGWVKVSVYVTQRRLAVVITDNGAGISEERLEFLHRAMKFDPIDLRINDEARHVGIALININRRIKLNYGKQFGITLSSTPDVRTTTEVVLPLLLNRK